MQIRTFNKHRPCRDCEARNRRRNNAAIVRQQWDADAIKLLLRIVDELPARALEVEVLLAGLARIKQLYLLDEIAADETVQEQSA